MGRLGRASPGLICVPLQVPVPAVFQTVEAPGKTVETPGQAAPNRETGYENGADGRNLGQKRIHDPKVPWGSFVGKCNHVQLFRAVRHRR